MNKHTKILFEHNNEFEGGFGIESAWATKEGKNLYKLDNVLFYAKGYSFGDVISVIEKDGEIYADKLFKESGHSTVRVAFNNIELKDDLIDQLIALGCETEVSDRPYLISVDIPKDIDYVIVQKLLQEGEDIEQWIYEEACIAHKSK